MKILCDLDGVLADPYVVIWSILGVRNPYARPRNLGDYDLESVTGFDKSCIWNAMDNRERWRNVPWMHDGHEFWRILYLTFMPRNITIVTRPHLTFLEGRPDWVSANCAAGKIDWINQNLGPITWDMHTSAEVRAKMDPTAVLIDDCDDNVEARRDAGNPAILYPRPWNSRHAESEHAIVCVCDELAQMRADVESAELGRLETV